MLQPCVNRCAVPQVAYSNWTENNNHNHNNIISHIPKDRVTAPTGLGFDPSRVHVASLVKKK
jgi:hypothetical protein